MEVRDRRGRVLSAQDLDEADRRDPQAVDGEQGGRRVASHRPKGEQGQDQRVEDGAVSTVPRDALLVGPEDRQVAPGRVARDQRDSHQGGPPRLGTGQSHQRQRQQRHEGQATG